jgi:hypothetical protein
VCAWLLSRVRVVLQRLLGNRTTFSHIASCSPLPMDLGLKQVMVANPDVVGEAAAFNWTALERILAGSTSRSAHAVVRFYVAYPGRTLEVPNYLVAAGIEMRNYTVGSYINEQSPHFDNAILLKGLQQFVMALGRQYDGDKRIAFLQAGLLGFWGEWHSMGQQLLSDHVCDLAVGWFVRAFNKTQINFRYPSVSVAASGRGVHDDSFAYETLDGKKYEVDPWGLA